MDIARDSFPVMKYDITIVSIVPTVLHEIDLIMLLYDFSAICVVC